MNGSAAPNIAKQISRFWFASVMSGSALLLACLHALGLNIRGVPYTPWEPLTLLGIAGSSFLISYIWVTVERRHGSQMANRWVALPVAITVGCLVLIGGYILSKVITAGLE